MLARKDIQRQIAVVSIVAVEKSPFLIAVNQVIGGIQVQNNLTRSRRVGVLNAPSLVVLVFAMG
jgi:hypothetical protein